MDSKFKIITGFIFLVLIAGTIMFIFDSFIPHETILDHIWHAMVGVIPAFTIYGIVAVRAYNRRKLAEGALRESEERYINAEKIGHFGHWSRYFNESKPTWSAGTYHIFGVDPDTYEPKYPDMLELVHPSDWELSKRAISNSRLHGDKFDIEYRIIRPDGEERIIHSVADVYFNKNGKPEKLFGTLQDITERKQAEEELRKFQVVIDNASYGVSIGPGEKLGYINRSFAEMHEYSPDELTGRHYSILYTEEQMAAINKLRDQLFQTGSFVNEEVWRKKKDGSIFPTLMSGNLIRDAKGNPSFLAGTLIDITGRKRAEKAIQTMAESAAGIAGQDFFHNMVRALCEWLRYDVALVGEFVDDSTVTALALQVDGKFVDEYRYALKGTPCENVATKGFCYYPENVASLFPDDKDLAELDLSGYVGIPLLDRHGYPLGILCAMSHKPTKIPERAEEVMSVFAARAAGEIMRKRMEEQLRHSQLLASLGEMTAGIAHEVNNPLSSILLYSELLLAGDIPREATKDLRAIHNEAKRAARIMTDLLTYGRKVEPKIHRVDLHKMLRKVINMRQYREKVQNINAFTYFHEVPLHVKGDANQLMQVFMNLMVNAEEALTKSNGGNITVTTRIHREWAKVSIADNGTGISEKNLNQVFHPFFTTKPTGQGTGLGLSTSYGIVTNHGGSIRVENNDMGGATFTVELPLAKVPRKRSST